MGKRIAEKKSLPGFKRVSEQNKSQSVLSVFELLKGMVPVFLCLESLATSACDTF